tara:strand:+ start:228 stop:989 length:762 start_codon:yes stop_codon:yes gene_type:complete
MWYKDLCEYYKVDPAEAILLSERKTGRRPNLPGSETCEPLSGKNWEEIWDSKPRETLQQKMEFYNEVGSWQSFRQCNYRKDFPFAFFYNAFTRFGDHILEYGSGVCPLANAFIEENEKPYYEFSFVEVECEHYRFGKWRLNKKSPDTKFNFFTVDHTTPTPDFGVVRKFDFVSMLDVLEHLPNPLDVIKKVNDHTNPGGYLLETWVEHDHDTGPSHADLPEAEEQREDVFKYINENFTLILEPIAGYRVWKKK